LSLGLQVYIGNYNPTALGSRYRSLDNLTRCPDATEGVAYLGYLARLPPSLAGGSHNSINTTSLQQTWYFRSANPSQIYVHPEIKHCHWTPAHSNSVGTSGSGDYTAKGKRFYRSDKTAWRSAAPLISLPSPDCEYASVRCVAQGDQANTKKL
jgi:hypothetical protein